MSEQGSAGTQMVSPDSVSVSNFLTERGQDSWHIPSSTLRRVLQVASSQLGADVTFSRAAGASSAVPHVEVRAQDGTLLGELRCPESQASTEMAAPVLELLAGLLAEVAQLDSSRVIPSAELDSTQERIARAARGEGMHSVLQPVIEIGTGIIVGGEALARFDEPPPQPDIWFSDAFAVGMELELDLAAARSALRLLDSLPPSAFLAVNISPSTLTSAQFAQLFAGVDLSRIVIEVTEHSPISDYGRIAEALAHFRAAGMRLAVDDAGAGYASFRHILLLRPDLIKIDISLVRDIHLDPVRQALVAAMASLARKTAATLIAEGVEIQAELDMLARLGVRHAQGFLLAKPSEELTDTEYPRPSPLARSITEVDDVSAEIARTVSEAHDLESLVRPLLDVVLRLTGLQSSYLTHLDSAKGMLHHVYVANAAEEIVPEGMVIPWEDSLCVRAHSKGIEWTSEVSEDMADAELAKAVGIQTFMSLPIKDNEGHTVATLCGLSTEPVYLGETALAQVRLCAHLIATSQLPVRHT